MSPRRLSRAGRAADLRGRVFNRTTRSPPPETRHESWRPGPLNHRDHSRRAKRQAPAVNEHCPAAGQRHLDLERRVAARVQDLARDDRLDHERSIGQSGRVWNDHRLRLDLAAGGAAVAIVAQLAIGWATTGSAAWARYFEVLWTLMWNPGLVQRYPSEIHSLRGFLQLLIPSASFVSVCSAVGLVVAMMAATRIWRPSSDGAGPGAREGVDRFMVRTAAEVEAELLREHGIA